MSSVDPLLVPVYAGDGYKPFGEFTPADVRARAEELRAVTGWGPTARVGSIARGWSELAGAMDDADAATVARLDPEQVAVFARRLWVVSPIA